MSETVAERIIKRVDNLKSKRSNWENHWQEIGKYCIPRKGFITTTRTTGEELPMRDVYDSTAINALKDLAGGLHGFLTNPSSQWFSLKIQDEELNKTQSVKLWLDSVSKKLFATLNSSNFNQQIHEYYLGFGGFGTGVMYSEPDPIDLIRFYARPLKECYISEDERGRITTVYRKFQMSAINAWEMWGKDAGESVSKALESKSPDKMIDFVHAVFPRDRREIGKLDSINMPFASFYIEVSKKHIISESGFMENPYAVSRFEKEDDEEYGYSPAMVALADIKMLNQMDKTIIRAAQKIVDPPLFMPHDGFLLPLRTTPGGLNYRLSTNANDKIEPLMTKANIPIGLELTNQRRDAINRAFFVNLFRALAMRPQKGKITAFEASEIVREGMVLLGPTVGRLMSELLDPILFRSIGILQRGGHLPEMPEALKGHQLVIEYVSPLAKSQKLARVTSIRNFLADIGLVAQISQEVTLKVDPMKVADELADGYGVPPTIMLSDKQVEKLLKERKEAVARQIALEQLKTGTQAAKTGAEAIAISREQPAA